MTSANSWLGRCVVGGALLVTGFGCANANNTQKGAALGAAGGAGLGAVIGHQFGSAGAGALIGGLAGTATGALVGNNKDEADRRDYYARQASHERDQRYREQRAITNRDVIEMHANGVGDSTIVNTMKDRGGNFDTTPQGIIGMKHSGVSDYVIQHMQANNMRR